MMDERHKTEDMTGSDEGGTDMPPSEGAGEDEGSAPKRAMTGIFMKTKN
jgi:hypothetical protein